MKTRKKTAPRTRSRRKSRKRKITPEDMVRFRWVSSPQISPDGSRMVFVRKHVGDKNNYVRNLWLAATDATTVRPLTAGGKDSEPRWSPDGLRIAFVGQRQESRPQIHVIDADGGEARAVTDLPEGSIGALSWSPNGKLIAFSFREQPSEWTEAGKKARADNGLSDPPWDIVDPWYRFDGDGYFGAARFHLWVVDVEAGQARAVFTKDRLGDFSWDFAPDSHRLVIAANLHKKAMTRPQETRLYRLDLRSGKLSEIPGLPPGPKESVRWSPSGELIAWAGREGRSFSYDTANLELWTCDPLKGNARSLTDRTDYCLLAVSVSDSAEATFASHIFFNPNGKRIYMRLGWHGETHLASIGARGGKVTIHTSGGAEYDTGNVAADGKTFAMVVSTPMALGEAHVGRIDRKGDVVSTPLSDFNGKLLSEVQLARPRSHWVRSTDGTRIQVWSMRPAGVSPRRKLPAVLEIHGGPHAQYGISFFHEMQCLAAQGYVVFYSNPRGSKGYGADHCAAIKGNWGSADWDDIQAATELMKRTEGVDAKRLGIMGGSYGGYMTNWAIGHSRDYKAAITDRCVSNLVSMAGSSDVIEEPGFYFPGNAWSEPEEMWRQSPLAYFGKVRTPTLIIHSEGDLRCNVEQAEQVFAALTLRGVATRLIRYPRTTSHGMSRTGPPDMRQHRLNAILGWWKDRL